MFYVVAFKQCVETVLHAASVSCFLFLALPRFVLEAYGSVPIVDGQLHLPQDRHPEDTGDSYARCIAQGLQAGSQQVGVILAKARENQ